MDPRSAAAVRHPSAVLAHVLGQLPDVVVEGLQISLQQLDAALLEVILWMLDARALAAVGSCGRSLRQLVTAVAAARCARAGADRSLNCVQALLQRRPNETFVQLLALREQAGRRAGGRQLLAAGAAHTVAVSPCGKLFACGRNGSGQLGTGQTHDNGYEEYEESLALVSPVGSDRIVCCSCGDESTLAVDDLGALFSWGHGHGSGEITVPLPRLVEMPVLVSSVASGGQHAAAIDVEGHLWTWGTGVNGQLGHPDATSLPKPKPVATFSEPCSVEGKPGEMALRASSVDCGAQHTAVIDSTGCLWTFGRGWLGHDSRPTLAQVTPRKVTMNTDVKFVDVSCGEGHTAVLTDEGALYTFGVNTSGQLGYADAHPRRSVATPSMLEHPVLRASGVVQVACGRAHTVVLTGLGAVYSWGDGSAGQLGHDECPPMVREIGNAPRYCSEPRLVAIPLPRLSGRAQANLTPGTGEPMPEPAPALLPDEHAERHQERAVEICCGAAHTVARLSSGRLVSWGAGSWGRLGQGGQQDAREPGEIVSPTRWAGWR